MSDRTCSVPECDRPAKTRGWCHGHYMRWYKTGDPGASPLTGPRGNTRKGPGSSAWKGEDLTYSGAHMRVRAVRGPASAHPCLHCCGPAAQWAFDHGGHPAPMGFSPDPAHYIPLCAPCHKRFDTRKIGVTPWPRTPTRL